MSDSPPKQCFLRTEGPETSWRPLRLTTLVAGLLLSIFPVLTGCSDQTSSPLISNGQTGSIPTVTTITSGGSDSQTTSTSTGTTTTSGGSGGQITSTPTGTTTTSGGSGGQITSTPTGTTTTSGGSGGQTTSTPTATTTTSGGSGGTAQPVDATAALTWDPVQDSSVSGYFVHYGRQSPNQTGSCTYESSMFVASTSVTVTNLAQNTRYYFAVSAYNGHEGVCSNEVSAVTPPASV